MLKHFQQFKVIFYSKFFQEKTETFIKKELKKQIRFEDEERMIMKPENENNVKCLNNLINSIFSIFNKK